MSLYRSYVSGVQSFRADLNARLVCQVVAYTLSVVGRLMCLNSLKVFSVSLVWVEHICHSYKRELFKHACGSC